MKNLLKICAVFALLTAVSACGSPCEPTELPCNIFVRTVTLEDGTKWNVFVNSRNELCSNLQPAK